MAEPVDYDRLPIATELEITARGFQQYFQAPKISRDVTQLTVWRGATMPVADRGSRGL